MLFALGFISGLLLATIVFICEILLSKRDKSITKVIEREIIKPPSGGIFIPKDDAEQARQDVIEKNEKLGKQTKSEDLYDN